MFSLTQFDWRDALDILLVAYVLYRLLLLIRGTRAVRVAIGLVLVSAIYAGARVMELRTVDWLLSNVFTYIVFAVIVLFQAELRRALASIGRNPFLRGLAKPANTGPLEDVVSAVTAMAAERRGAIIVFERSVGLRNYVDQGIRLDALVSYDLLFSIFHKEAPLHDGAVIIQGDRIAAAACFLPLTTNPRLSRDLGTRHRAAIGVSEESDAAVVVVSEETGAISLAINGRITRRLDAATLRARLAELLHPARGAGGGSDGSVAVADSAEEAAG